MIEPKEGYKEFNWKQFERICSLPPIVTQEHIAFFMGVSVDTCDRKIRELFPLLTFADFRRLKQGGMNIAIISKQYELALKQGYWPALKWMGINYAGQSDRVLVEDNLEDKSLYNEDEL